MLKKIGGLILRTRLNTNFTFFFLLFLNEKFSNITTFTKNFPVPEMVGKQTLYYIIFCTYSCRRCHQTSPGDQNQTKIRKIQSNVAWLVKIEQTPANSFTFCLFTSYLIDTIQKILFVGDKRFTQCKFSNFYTGQKRKFASVPTVQLLPVNSDAHE